MPMLITVLIRSPVAPRHSPLRTRSAKALIRARTSWTSGTTFVTAPSSPTGPSTVPAGARRATCSTARCSLVLIGSPPNIASRRAVTPAAPATAMQRRQHLVGDALLGVVDAQVADLDDVARGPTRVVGEQLGAGAAAG